MPMLTSDALANILIQYVGQSIPSLTAQNDSLFSLLYSRKQAPSDDRGCRWKPSTDVTEASTFAQGGSYGEPGRVTYLDALNPWARYVDSVVLSEETFIALMKGAKHAGDELANQVVGAIKRIMRKADAHLRTNDRSTGDVNGFSGIPEIVSASNVFAGINRSTETAWQAYINSSGGALTEALMDDVHDKITHDRIETYDTVIASPTFVRDALALNGVTKADPPRVEAGGNLPGYLGAFGMNRLAPAAFFNQRPVIGWSGWVDGRMDFLRMGDLVMEVHKDFAPGAPVKIPGADQYAIEITFIAQVKYDNPRTAGALTGLTT